MADDRRDFAGRLRGVAVPAVGAVSIVALSVAAWAQAGYWRDSRTVFSRAVAVTERNWLALNHLGLAHEDVGRTQQAIPLYREALRVSPDLAVAWANLGAALTRLGQTEEAAACYAEARRLDSNKPTPARGE